MTEPLFPLENWLAHSTLAGGFLLLAGVALMVCTRQPARRQRLGELALLSSLVVAGLCLLPAWLPYSIPLWPAAAAAATDAPEQPCACLEAVSGTAALSRSPVLDEETETLEAWLAMWQWMWTGPARS